MIFWLLVIVVSTRLLFRTFHIFSWYAMIESAVTYFTEDDASNSADLPVPMN